MRGASPPFKPPILLFKKVTKRRPSAYNDDETAFLTSKCLPRPFLIPFFAHFFLEKKCYITISPPSAEILLRKWGNYPPKGG